MPRICFAALCLFGLIGPVTANAQLPDTLLAQVRAGASNAVLRGDSFAVPLVGTPTLPLVEVMINGRGPYRFLIDLGSNVVVVRSAVAAAAGGTIVVDRDRGDIIRFDSVSVGSLLLEAVVAAGYDDLDVDGVLGYNVLRYHSFELDYANQRLLVHAGELPPADQRTVFSYSVEGRMPMLVVSIGADSLRVNLDTGAAETLTIPPGLQDRLRWSGPITPGRVTTNNQTGEQRVYEGTLRDQLRIGPVALDNVRVFINPDADHPWIGSSAMRHARWTFDPKNERVRITPVR